MTQLTMSGDINKAGVEVTVSEIDAATSTTITSDNTGSYTLPYDGTIGADAFVIADPGTAVVGEDLKCYVEKGIEVI